MRRIRPGRLLLTVLVLGFAIFFGLDLATHGMERVQGPSDQVGKPAAVAHQPSGTAAGVKTSSGTAAAAGTVKAGAAASNPSKQPAAAQQGAKTQAAQAASGQPKIEVKESFLNHLSNRIGDALHHGAKAIIGLIVALFDAIVT